MGDSWYFSGNRQRRRKNNGEKTGQQLALTGMLCLTTFAGTQTVSAETADSAKQVDIVFTHDTHSHLNTFTTVVDDAEKEVGGFARINTLIQEQKAKNPDTLVIDGGDFPWEH